MDVFEAVTLAQRDYDYCCAEAADRPSPDSWRWCQEAYLRLCECRSKLPKKPRPGPRRDHGVRLASIARIGG